jgi:hypothetical protein
MLGIGFELSQPCTQRVLVYPKIARDLGNAYAPIPDQSDRFKLELSCVLLPSHLRFMDLTLTRCPLNRQQLTQRNLRTRVRSFVQRLKEKETLELEKRQRRNLRGLGKRGLVEGGRRAG